MRPPNVIPSVTYLKHLIQSPELGLELHPVEHASLSHLENVPQLLQVPLYGLLCSNHRKGQANAETISVVLESRMAARRREGRHER